MSQRISAVAIQAARRRTKQSGWLSETIGSVINPLSVYGTIGGAATAGFTPTKSLSEVAEADNQSWQNIVIPGRAGYNTMKRTGAVLRGPEVLEIRLAKLKREIDALKKGDKPSKDEGEAKEAGIYSEFAGAYLNPSQLALLAPPPVSSLAYVPDLLGASAAAVTPTRTLSEQVDAENTVASNFLPGVAAYNSHKRLGAAIRSPEMRLIRLENKERGGPTDDASPENMQRLHDEIAKTEQELEKLRATKEIEKQSMYNKAKKSSQYWLKVATHNRGAVKLAKDHPQRIISDLDLNQLAAPPGWGSTLRGAGVGAGLGALGGGAAYLARRATANEEDRKNMSLGRYLLGGAGLGGLVGGGVGYSRGVAKSPTDLPRLQLLSDSDTPPVTRDLPKTPATGWIARRLPFSLGDAQNPPVVDAEQLGLKLNPENEAQRAELRMSPEVVPQTLSQKQRSSVATHDRPRSPKGLQPERRQPFSLEDAQNPPVVDAEQLGSKLNPENEAQRAELRMSPEVVLQTPSQKQRSSVATHDRPRSPKGLQPDVKADLVEMHKSRLRAQIEERIAKAKAEYEQDYHRRVTLPEQREERIANRRQRKQEEYAAAVARQQEEAARLAEQREGDARMRARAVAAPDKLVTDPSLTLSPEQQAQRDIARELGAIENIEQEMRRNPEKYGLKPIPESRLQDAMDYLKGLFQ